MKLSAALEVFVCSVGVGDSPLRVTLLEQLQTFLCNDRQARIEAVASLEGLRALLKHSGITGDLKPAQGKYVHC